MLWAAAKQFLVWVGFILFDLWRPERFGADQQRSFLVRWAIGHITWLVHQWETVDAVDGFQLLDASRSHHRRDQRHHLLHFRITHLPAGISSCLNRFSKIWRYHLISWIGNWRNRWICCLWYEIVYVGTRKTLKLEFKHTFNVSLICWMSFFEPERVAHSSTLSLKAYKTDQSF